MISLPVGFYIALQSSTVQTYLTNRISSHVFEKYNARLSIKKIDIAFVNTVLLEELFLQDKNKDTLAFLKQLEFHVLDFVPGKNNFYLEKIVLDGLYAKITEDSACVANYQFLIDAFASDEKKELDTSKSDIKLFCQNFEIKNSGFVYQAYNPRYVANGLNSEDIKVTDFNLAINKLSMHGDTIDVHLANISVKEKCGFALNNMSTYLRFTGKCIDLRDFKLKTNNTEILAPVISLSYDSLGDFSDFMNRVPIRAEIEKLDFGADDLAFVVPELWGINQRLRLSGKFTGRVCDIEAKKLNLEYGSKTCFRTDARITGLPDINKMEMDVRIKKLALNSADLSKIKLPPYNKSNPLVLPPEVLALGNINYSGTISGNMNNLKSKGVLKSDAGEIETDLSMKNDTIKKTTEFDGVVKLNNMYVAKILKQEGTLGSISADLSVKGKLYGNNKIDAEAKGNIASVDYNNYRYSNITLEGGLKDKLMRAKLSINDPSVTLSLDAKGVIDKVSEINLMLNVDRADLKALNFNKTDTQCLVSLNLSGDLKGSNPDDLYGQLILNKVYYANHKGSISMQDFVLDINDYFTYKKISLYSDLLEVDIVGQYKTFPLISALSEQVYRFMPVLASKDYKPQKDTVINNIKFDVRIKRTDEICKLFAPDVKLSPKTVISGKFNSQTGDLSFSGRVPEFVSGTQSLHNLNINAFTENNILSVNIEGSKINTGSMIVENINLNADIKNDSVYLLINNHNRDSVEYGIQMALLTYFTKSEKSSTPVINIEFNESELVLGDVTWLLEKSKIKIDTTAISINNFKLSNRGQYINITGKVSSNPADTLAIYFNKVDLSAINSLTGADGPKITGRLDGFANVNDVYKKVIFGSDLSIKSMTLNQEMLGNTFIKAGWNEETQKVALNLFTKIGKVKTLTVNGDYSPANQQIAFDISLNRLKLNILQPYLTGIVSGLKGEANGNFTVSGTAEKPMIEGTVDILETYFTLDFSKVRYCIKNSIQIKNDAFVFEEFNIFDPNWKMLVLNGSITHKNFSDMKLDLIMKTTDDAFMFLNTEESDNDAFYGTAFMTGLFKINGPPENIVVDISAKTEKDTYFYIPLTSTSEATESDFIKFVSKNEKKDSTLAMKDEKVDLSGVTLNFDLEITPDAEAQIVFDQKTGDLIKGRGNSNLKIEITTLGKFNMYGDFVIDRGDYLFTLQNIINKKFEVEKGGTISWNGDPLAANVDLKAVYKLKAPLFDLILDDNEIYKKRSAVECHLAMTNKLMEPIISFDIGLPNADEKIKNLLSTLSTDERNKQFLSLLVLNRFITPENIKGNLAGGEVKRSTSIGGVTSSELLSNQLSHWLSQISNDFDIGVNYRPGDEISSDQVEVALSTQLLDDRVIINGNVGIGNQKANSSGVVGDFDIAYKITKNGKLRVKAFTKANDNIISTSPYTQGMGFYYREDFNTVGELMRRYWDAVFGRKQL